MKAFKKLLSIVLALVFALSCVSTASALSLEDDYAALCEEFIFGEGPVVDGYSIDYRYFSPVSGEDDTTKYPLVVWLHGMGDGAEEGRQVTKSQIAYWATDEFQARFQSAGGAYILAARSREENGKYWDNDLVEPLKAAIEEFVAENENVDTTRIYVGGYSMGGKMTLKMSVAYPEMFAAAFPICPAWSVPDEYIDCIADLPIWLTSSSRDPLVNYHLAVTPAWNRMMSASNVAEDCRFSTLTKVCYADGTKTSSSHHAWFAVNYDMFAIDNGAYPYMTTVNGVGEEVTLTYPDGMISWLSQFTSDYDGTPIEGMGNLEGGKNTDSMLYFSGIGDFFEVLFNAIRMIFGGC